MIFECGYLLNSGRLFLVAGICFSFLFLAADDFTDFDLSFLPKISICHFFLFLSLAVYFSTLAFFLSSFLFFSFPFYLPGRSSVFMSFVISFILSVCLSFCLSVSLSRCLSLSLPLCFSLSGFLSVQ